MITQKDIEKISALKKTLSKELTRIYSNEKADLVEAIDRIVGNLKIAPFCYRDAPKDDVDKGYYTAECEKCDWWGNSKYLGGGGQLADSGDYDDCYCPVCGSKDINERN